MKRLSLENQTTFRNILNYSTEAQNLLSEKEFVEKFEPLLGPVSLYSTEEGLIEQLDHFQGRIGFIYLFVTEQTSPTLTIGLQMFPVALTL